MAKDKPAAEEETKRKPWALSEAALDILLTRLDADRMRASEKYEQLRECLIGIFCWKGADNPEDLADSAIDRLARKLKQGEQIHDLSAYARAVAHKVFLENVRHPHSRHEELTDQQLMQPPQPETDLQEVRLNCLDQCLAQLPPAERDLVLRYYHEERRAKIDNRKELAESLDLTPHALTVKVSRIRKKLEECMRDCLEKV